MTEAKVAERTPDQGGVRRRAATRERLLDAARVVLANEGIQGASVEHICEQAGFTRGAFYSNFSTKDELLLALCERESEDMFEKLQLAADPSAFAGLDVNEAVWVVFERFLMMQPPDRDWFLVQSEFELRSVRDEPVGREFRIAWTGVKREFQDLMVGILETIGLRLTIDPHDALVMLMGTYDMALRESLIENRPMDTELLKRIMPPLLLASTEPIDS
jgi:AcrR family transcriptional regulator